MLTLITFILLLYTRLTIFFLLNAEYLLWHFFLNMYRALVARVWLILQIWLLKKGVHLVIAVDCHAVLGIRFHHVGTVADAGTDGEVRGNIRAIAFMIHSIIDWDFRLLTLLPSSCPHRLCLHCWFGILAQYLWLEAAALHHFTLKVLKLLILAVLIEFRPILKFVWINNLCVLNDTLLAYLTHQPLGLG